MAPKIIEKFVEKTIPIQNSPIGWLQVIFYVLSVMIGMCVAVPIGITLRNFKGMCLLFAQVVWDDEVIFPWSDPSCDYVMYTTVAICIVYAALMALFTAVAIWPTVADKHYEKLGKISKWNAKYVLSNLTCVLVFVNTIICLMLLCVACVLTAGFIYFCEFFEESLKDRGMEGTCASGQDMDWSQFRVVWGDFGDIDGQHYHNCLTLATICSWILLGIWITQLVFSCSMCCRRCSCEVAEEKQKPDRAKYIAQRRSRMATPIGTPGGGGHMPVPLGQPMPQPYQPPPQRSRNYPPSQSSYHSQGPAASYGAPPGGQPYGMPMPYQPAPQRMYQRRQDRGPYQPQQQGVSLPQKGVSESTA